MASPKPYKLVAINDYQDIGTVGQTPAQLAQNMQSIDQTFDVGLRRTRNINSSWLRVSDLVGVGLVTLNGNEITAAVTSGAASTLTVNTSTGVNTLVFTGSGVSVAVSGSTATITISGGGGSALTVTDGTHSVSSTTSITFSGATVSGSGGAATVTVSSGSNKAYAPGGVGSMLYYWFQADLLTGAASSNIPTLFNSVAGVSPFSSFNVNGSATGATLAVADLNGLNTADFGGAGNGRYGVINSGFAAPLSPQVTAFYVLKMASPGTAQVLLSGVSGSLQIGTDGTGKMALVSDLVAVLATNTAALPAGTYFQQNVTFNNTTLAYSFRTSQAADGSGTASGSFSNATSNFIGWNQPVNVQDLNGNLAEFIIYNRVLSASEILAVEAYLHSKWGV